MANRPPVAASLEILQVLVKTADDLRRLRALCVRKRTEILRAVPEKVFQHLPALRILPLITGGKPVSLAFEMSQHEMDKIGVVPPRTTHRVSDPDYLPSQRNAFHAFLRLLCTETSIPPVNPPGHPADLSVPTRDGSVNFSRRASAGIRPQDGKRSRRG